VGFGSYLRDFVRQHRLGRVYLETGFVLQRDPDTVRGPDVAFVATKQLPGGRSPDGYIEGAPTLAVEILSPSNTRAEIADKTQEYLEAGATAVWVLNLRRRSVTVHTVDGTTVYNDGDTLPGGEALPGFALALDELFSEILD